MLTCFAKCRHRSANKCGLLLQGLPIVLNGVGQCEMKEEPVVIQGPAYCTYEGCRESASSNCTLCDTGICSSHTWLYKRMFLCLSCWMSHGPADMEVAAR